MIRVAVVSSELRSVGYDDLNRCLEIEFQNLSIYQYFEVPAEEHTSLMSAPSKGRYFNAHIRNVYSCKRIDA